MERTGLPFQLAVPLTVFNTLVLTLPPKSID